MVKAMPIYICVKMALSKKFIQN